MPLCHHAHARVTDKTSGCSLSRLKLRDFRNYETLSLETDQAMIVLVGPNGAGKTNILEAISFLAPGKGLRRAAIGTIRRAQASEDATWSVNATLPADDGETIIGTGPKPGSGPDSASRMVRINRVTATSNAALSEHVRLSWVAPAMDGLFTGTPGDRRRFLDRLVLTLDPGQSKRVSAFEKVMRDRNKLLSGGSWDTVWLDALEAQMADHAVAIAAGRNDLIARLQAVIAKDQACVKEGPFPWARIGIEGTLEQGLENARAVEVEDKYRAMLCESRARDSLAGRTLDGPHRTDLLVFHGPKGIEARSASTGEQKSLLIGLILAHARLVADTLHGRAPIMLMDEVAAHLDQWRREALFERLLDLGGQAWVTGTDQASFESLGSRAQLFHVEDGRVRQVEE